MGRLMAIDYGRKRCGIAVTDVLQIVANSLTTVATCSLIDYVKNYCRNECVDRIIVGFPRKMDGTESESMTYIRPGIARLRKALPDMSVVFFDERFTSAIAHQSMIDGGMKKKQRQDKAIVDSIAASIILNDYLESKKYNSQL